jgi:hypothetical protein
MMKYIQRIKPGGISILCRSLPGNEGQEFIKTIGNDKFELRESEAGIYITVVTYRSGVCCTELLYGLGRATNNFWLLSREWSGEDFKPGTKFARDSQYPIGKQVSLGKCLTPRENPKSSQSLSTQSNSSTTTSVGSSTASV